MPPNKTPCIIFFVQGVFFIEKKFVVPPLGGPQHKEVA